MLAITILLIIEVYAFMRIKEVGLKVEDEIGFRIIFLVNAVNSVQKVKIFERILQILEDLIIF